MIDRIASNPAYYTLVSNALGSDFNGGLPVLICYDSITGEYIMDKIIFCSDTKKYYKKLLTEDYISMEKRMRRLERSLTAAKKSNDAKLIGRINLLLADARQKRYKGVVYQEVLPEAVPEDAKISTMNHPPNATKHRVIRLQ